MHAAATAALDHGRPPAGSAVTWPSDKLTDSGGGGERAGGPRTPGLRGGESAGARQVRWLLPPRLSDSRRTTLVIRLLLLLLPRS